MEGDFVSWLSSELEGKTLHSHLAPLHPEPFVWAWLCCHHSHPRLCLALGHLCPGR